MTAQTSVRTRAPGLLLVGMLVASPLISRSGTTPTPRVEPAPIRAARALPEPPEVMPSVPVAPQPARVRPAAGAVTGWFGEHRGSRRHPGVDFDGETGDAVWAAAAGTVVNAGTPLKGYSGYGTVVIVNHPDGVYTLYAHLSSVDVTQGQVVSAGQRLGGIGTTGNVTGSHLHFEVRRDGGQQLDPGTWLAGATPPATSAVIPAPSILLAVQRAVLPA